MLGFHIYLAQNKRSAYHLKCVENKERYCGGNSVIENNFRFAGSVRELNKVILKSQHFFVTFFLHFVPILFL